MTTRARIAALVVDCAEVAPMVAFYGALGAVPDARHPGLDAYLLDGLTLCFRASQHHRPPRWPDSEHPSQLHLDLVAADPEITAQELALAGGTVPDFQPHRGDGLIVVLDPVGHPVCIGTPL